MLNKVILQTQFGTPHPWSEQYFDNVRTLAPYGWSLYVFTPNLHPGQSGGNIRIVPMTIEQFDQLLGKQTGVSANNHLVNGKPAKFVSDYYPAYGRIFQEYIEGFDYWAHTNWDMVYGRLDHFLPDAELEKHEIWADDVRAINGIFTVYRNNEHVNNLFRLVPEWQAMFRIHELFGFDERHMTLLVRDLVDAGKLALGGPPYYGYHSYDRLPQHLPTPRLEVKPDGALIELFPDLFAQHLERCEDTAWRGRFGREIMSFHFSRTKRWPL